MSNLSVTANTARSFLSHASGQGTGSLVLVGSTAGIYGEAGHSDYAAAKGAITTGLLLSLKNEVSRIGSVRVNAVAPGWTMTPEEGRIGTGRGDSREGEVYYGTQEAGHSRRRCQCHSGPVLRRGIGAHHRPGHRGRRRDGGKASLNPWTRASAKGRLLSRAMRLPSPE